MGFGLFIVLNALLFIRPGELVPSLEGLPLYQATILACTMTCFAAVVRQLEPDRMLARPVTVCVVGLVAAVVLSHLANGSTWDARVQGWEALKLAVYYFLLVAVVNTPSRLRRFLMWLTGFVVVLAVVAVLQFRGVIDVPGLESVQEATVQEDTGETVFFPRLCGAGIFNDPNDLALVLVTGMTLCLCHADAAGPGLCRFAWLLPLAPLAYAFHLTQSRGGLIALLAALLALAAARMSRWKSLALAAVAVPALLLLLAGRQTNLTTSEGTGQSRIQLWSEGFAAFRQAPVFGIGQGRYEEQMGLVAHNSFVHSYTELGFVGGTLFVGAFFLAMRSLFRLNASALSQADPELGQLRPYLFALVAGYAGGMLSLSRAFVVPTFLVLGLVTAFVELAAVRVPAPLPRWGWLLAAELSLVSVAFVATTYVFLRLSVRWS